MSIMKAIHFRKEAGPEPDSLELQSIPIPIPGPTDLLVQVKASSVNPVDTKIRQGKFPASDITGFDCAGIVHSTGANVVSFEVGDEVYFAGSLGRPGSMAQYTVIDHRLVSKKPKSLDFGEAAGYPLVSLTAWESFVDHFNLIPLATMDTLSSKTNDNAILIINGAGGVGSIATQLARKVFKLKTVIVTASRPETVAHAEKMGATHVINHHEALRPQIESILGPVDENGGGSLKYALICYDTQKYLPQLSPLMSPFGKIASIVETDSPIPFHAPEAFSKSLSFSWTFMMTRPTTGYNMESQGRVLKQLAKLIDSGKVGGLVTDSKPLSVKNLREAHEKLESGKMIGKMVFTVGDGIE